MRQGPAIALHTKILQDELATRTKKAHDYSGDDDVLKNFKFLADMMDVFERYGCKVDMTTPWGVAMFMVLLKLVRWANLTATGEKPHFESLDDTVLDGRCYWELARECWLECNGQAESE